MFGLISSIPIGLGFLAIIWFIYEEYCCFIQIQYDNAYDVILNAIGNIIFIVLIWISCVGLIGLINYIYNTLHTNCIITTKYEVESNLDLTDSNIAPGKYVIYDSNSNKYCYYTISFNETVKNIESGENIVVLPVLDINSSYTPQFICQINKQKGYYPNTSSITNKDCINEDYEDTTINILIVPIDGILYESIPDS